MNIIFDCPQVEELKQRHTVLELDSFWLPNIEHPVKSWCVVETVPIVEIDTIEHYAALHDQLINHYKQKNWQVCQDAIALLIGRWGGELDSFYRHLNGRIVDLSQQQLPESWDGAIVKSLPSTQVANQP